MFDLNSLAGGMMGGQQKPQDKNAGFEQALGVVPYLGPLMQAKTALMRQVLPPGPKDMMGALSNSANIASGIALAQQRRQAEGMGAPPPPPAQHLEPETPAHPERPTPADMHGADARLQAFQERLRQHFMGPGVTRGPQP